MINSRKIMIIINEVEDMPTETVQVATSPGQTVLTKFEPIESPQERSYALEAAMDEHIGSRKERE